MRLFDWDNHNEQHIGRHDVEPYEAEEAMSDLLRVTFDTHGKGIRGVIGKTEDGRILVVIYTMRNGLYRVSLPEMQTAGKNMHTEGGTDKS